MKVLGTNVCNGTRKFYKNFIRILRANIHDIHRFFLKKHFMVSFMERVQLLDNLHLTTTSPGVPGTHPIELKGMKD